MRETKIKICGIRTVSDALLLNKYEIDYAGFVVFYEKSKRYVTIEKAKELMEVLDKSIKKVAVTVSPTVEEIEAIERSGFDYIQIHGILAKESFDAIRLPILRAFNVTDMDKYLVYKECHKVAGYVFDAVVPGSGETFDWSLVKDMPKDDKIFILAGGLSDSNVAQAIKYINPQVVDVSSSVENDFGKDEEKIIKFVRSVEDAK